MQTDKPRQPDNNVQDLLKLRDLSGTQHEFFQNSERVLFGKRGVVSWDPFNKKIIIKKKKTHRHTHH